MNGKLSHNLMRESMRVDICNKSFQSICVFCRDIDDPKFTDEISVACIGHVDSGKSTLAGHLIYKNGLWVSKDDLDMIESKLDPKLQCKYAWIMDRQKNERLRGNTIDLSYSKLVSQKRIYSIIDAPGHRNYIKNTYRGLAQADACLLVVSAV